MGVRRWFPAVLVVVTLGVACDGDPAESKLPPGVVEGSVPVAPGTTAASPLPTSSATGATCANEDAVAESPARQIGTALEADVDGDGSADRIALAADPAGEEGCAAFVVVDLGGGLIAAAPVWEVGTEGGLPEPRLHGVADLDRRPGNEILVDEAAGASTQFVGAFVFVDGDLQRITVSGGFPAGAGASFGDLFPYGGSVGHLDAADCGGDGIVISNAVPSSDQGEMARGIYDVERRFFTFDDAQLEVVDTERSEIAIGNLNRLIEFGNSPFGSC